MANGERAAPASRRLERWAWAAWRSLRAAIGRNAHARRLVYRLRNRRLFSDLSQHDRMLGDAVRVEAYWSALQRHVRKGDVVVDLGTGSGVLAFFASKAGAERVHAIEHGPVIDVARQVARENGVGNVQFHRTHSGSFDPGEQVDVIVHEQIGEALFDEQVVENVADLRNRVLKPGGLILPAHLRLYVEPVQLQSGARLPYAWRQRLHGIDFGALEQLADSQPRGYVYRPMTPFPLERFLTAPAPVVTVDLHHAQPSDLPRELHYRRPVVADGTLDGLCVYFDAGFDDEIGFSSSPAARTTHWGAPLLRMDSVEVSEGDEIDVRLHTGGLSYPGTWHWDVTVHRSEGER